MQNRLSCKKAYYVKWLVMQNELSCQMAIMQSKTVVFKPNTDEIPTMLTKKSHVPTKNSQFQPKTGVPTKIAGPKWTIMPYDL